MSDEQPSDATAIALAGDHAVHIRRGGEIDSIELRARDGRLVFAIEVSERGPVLRFEGPALTVKAAGELALEADDLVLRGTRSLALETGGDLTITASGDLRSVARTQTITADLGDVQIEASDDVHVDGERVLVNC